MIEKMNRREFLIKSLGTLAYVTLPKTAKELPNWIDEIPEELFESLVVVCTKVLSEDELLDFLDIDTDYETAIGAAYGFLSHYLSEEETDKMLILEEFLSST